MAVTSPPSTSAWAIVGYVLNYVEIKIRGRRSATLWALAAPMMLSNISVALLGLVDTAVIGHLEHASYLAGVAIAAVLFDFLYWGVTFLRMGTSGVTAQQVGAQDWSGARSTLREGLVIAMLIALAMLALQALIADFGFALLGPSEAAAAHARTYFNIKIWGAPGVLASMVCIGWLIGMQNARAAMALAAGPCLVHAALDILLVIVLEQGVPGAAVAAVITAYLSAAYGAWLVTRELRRHDVSSKPRWSWASMRKLVHLNGNILARTLCLIATFAFFTKQGARQGDVILAANTVLLNFQMLTALGLDGFANALEALIGRAVGARNRTDFNGAVVVGTLWSVVFAAAFTALYLLFGRSLIALLTDIETVRVAASSFLIWAAISPLLSVWCFIFDGVFIGATRGAEMRNSMLFSTVVVFLPAWYFLQSFGNDGLWVAFLLFFVARGVSMGWYFAYLVRRRVFF